VARPTPSWRSKIGEYLGAIVVASGMSGATEAFTLQDLPPPVLQLTRSLSSERHVLTESWLEVRVNGSSIGKPARIVRLAGGQLCASAEDLVRWRIRAPERAPLSVRGKDYFPLDTIHGIEYEIDERTQTLQIQGRANVFTPTVISSRNLAYSPPDRVSIGGFVNYDLQIQTIDDERRTDGLLEAGVFNRWGFGTSTFLARGGDERRRVLRLETAWTKDDPSELRSLRIGDSIGRPGSWGRSVRFGGLQWGTDFLTRPDFVQFPLPTISGEALLPSTVDLYVDNALRLSRNVPYGPFNFPNLPVISGEGQVRLVVRDLLGRESVIVQPYYISSGLLREGLHDYTYEAGFVRRDFAVESNEYGRFFVAGTHRLGLSDGLTGELRAEVMAYRQTLGAGASYLWPDLGLVDVAAAVSSAPSGAGGFLLLGIERQGRPVSFGVQTRLASPEFVQLGASAAQPVARQATVARANYAAGGAGSIFVSYFNQEIRVAPRVEFVTAGYNVNLFRSYYLSLFALRRLGADAERGIGVTLTRAFGARTTGSVGWNSSGDDSSDAFQLQQSLPFGPGFGYRIARTGGVAARNEASLFAQGDYGSYRVEAAQTGDATGYRVGASGGVAVLGGGMHLSRRLDDSFAVVKVGNYPDVPVYMDNQPVARTDADGLALVPLLRPYQKNDIRIDQDALPLNAQVGTLRASATPSRRSGTLVDFAVHAVRGAVIRIVLADGGPIPAGAVARVDGQANEFPVALRGEAYVTGLRDRNEIRVSWKGRSCQLDVPLPADAGPLPVLGPFVCEGVAR